MEQKETLPEDVDGGAEGGTGPSGRGTSLSPETRPLLLQPQAGRAGDQASAQVCGQKQSDTLPPHSA